MNNESVKSPKINYTTVSTTSISANHIKIPSANISNSETTATLFTSISSASSSLSPSAQFDVTVSAIAAVVNASNQLPVTTPSNAAAVVAVAVSSLAAAIIPDIPIVSIAGSTFSEITTTTTSTKTTPTPVPTSKETGGVSNNSNSLNTNSNKNANLKGLQNKSPSSPSSTEQPPSLTSYFTSRVSVKGLGPMSVANSSVTGALTNAPTTAANAAAAEIDNKANSTKQLKDNSTSNTAKGSSTKFRGDTKSESLSTPTESKTITATATNLSNSLTSQPTTASTIKNEDVNVTPNETKSKEFTSESWEESRLKDWDDSKLKELLDEAYSYKNPRDKENKSKTFLQLLEKAENEDQSYPFCVTSRGSRNLSNSITSNSYHQYQQNSHYHSHNHNHNRSQYKQGGSLQDLFEIGLHESQLDCDPTFGIGISSNQRTRRQNHNSRQKKYSSSVSSRQREGGSLPSNVNATHQLNVGVSGVVNDLSLMQQEGSSGICTSKASKKEQRRNASKAAASNVCTEAKENNTASSVGETTATGKNTTPNTTSAYNSDGGDFIIDMGEPMMDIQQQQKILQCKGQDAATQGHPFYERLANNDKRIPRANIIGSAKGTYFAPTTSHCYVDETVRFNALERNGGTNNVPTSSTIDAKFLPLDENYKSCKSVLGSDSEKSPEILSKSKSNTIYTKISAPASGSAVLTGTTNNIATLAQRQLDENGNALSEIYHNSTGAGAGSGATIQINAVSPTTANASAALLNSCGNVSTSATVTISPHTASTTVSTSATVTTTFTSGPSQAKAKAKKKSQQERNTKTVDVESVAGYRGKDPVEELVKYIESSGEDKQAGSGSGSKSGDKKKERKKDKEKHQKLKKSNSLEELRSGAKMEVHELKRTAATTESNAVLIRQKSGGGGKQNKNNSSSAADINKNLEGKNSTQTTNSRKSDRRSWGNEDLKYLEDHQNANVTNEEKTVTASAHTAKERKSKVGSGGIATSTKEEKDIKDKTNERNERNLANNVAPITTIQFEKSDRTEKSDKLEKLEKLEKTEKSDKADKSENKVEKSEKRKKQDIPPNAVTVVDILAIESVLPETAEFHVVTKKKKPKKQKVINNLEETTVTFNRTHNFTMQKTSTFNQQQQQMTVRYKYYHHDNAPNTGISNTNTNSQNYQQASSQQHQQSSSNFNSSNVVGAQNSHTQHQNQQQHQQQQQQHNLSENYANTTDKSRRKSTSSVPPSEKSDSSDLDSVHSLPIESSKVNATSAASKTAKGNTQQRTKSVKNNNASLANNNSSTPSKNQNSPAPISYADIARTNKEIADAAASASGILINNNEISTECRNSDAPQTNTADSFTIEDKTGACNVNTATTSSVTTVANAATKPHKTKKSQIKQDFPELSSTSAVSNDDKVASTNVNHKTITYSQSLTAVTNLTQNTTSTQSHGSGGVSSASDSSPVSSTDVNTKASPTDHHRNLIIHQHAHIPPVQHPQQQILQKSKSVENDSSSTSTNSSSSSANNYMASLNSNNLDQQYPALEKTVKRHSSATIIGTATNIGNLTPFNFAAAAKQQMTTNVFDQNNINLNKNSALTTSNTTNSNITIQAALLMSTNSNEGISGSTSTININTNKKSKEKTPPLLATTNSALTQDSSVNSNTPNLTTTTVTNPKKSKKERQQQQLQMQQSSVESSQVKHNQNNNSNPVSNKKPCKTQLKSSNSLPLGLVPSGSHTNTTTSTVNRPAVIILNDDRNSGSCAADNQFTFGDFNEEELKLFDDDSHATVVENPIDNIDINANQSEEEEKHQQTAYSETAFNDSGASCGNDMANNSTSDMLLSSSIEASSPNTSFVANCHGNNGGVGAIHIPALINNQSSDSGIYTDKIKSSNSSCSSNSSNGAVGGSSIVTSMQKQKQQMSPTKEENNKLNTFLTNTKCASVHTSMDNLNPPPPPPPLPPQQLETCNDIETAIIAAARAAAKHQQAPHSHHQQQKQQYKNSNTSSNSSSFSSSSLSSTTSAYQHHKQQKQQHHYNSNISSNRNYQNQHGSGNTVSYHQPHHHFDDDYDDIDDDSVANTPRSRSPSRPRRISIAGGTVVNKEFDIHFIPPTTMPTAFSTQHHNDVIIDFIGSAWEEVANSKVTKVYDGQ